MSFRFFCLISNCNTKSGEISDTTESGQPVIVQDIKKVRLTIMLRN